ncbi:hypothetical protein [Sandaracinobacteroides saxicola]|uniref:Uncharacterized protein n=1 Tax=Sandaracinobacteroides saxicola TaxID=2759707 RepID=A0A7G5IL31_9SPHN|nr:hypothetical protein [Sandaracinobacteroides saxicola]QMW24073.1 hypothetical protein H3309_06320 [Sandaracinobacteroides saxicola]
MTAFHRTWLNLWLLLVIGFGLILAGAALPATEAPVRLFYALVGAPLPSPLGAELRFTLALLGAVTLGWALTIHAAFQAAFALRTDAAATWRRITFAILAWYVIDSALSVALGVPLNAVSNTVLLVAYLLPILRSRALQR